MESPADLVRALVHANDAPVSLPGSRDVEPVTIIG